MENKQLVVPGGKSTTISKPFWVCLAFEMELIRLMGRHSYPKTNLFDMAVARILLWDGSLSSGGAAQWAETQFRIESIESFPNDCHWMRWTAMQMGKHNATLASSSSSLFRLHIYSMIFQFPATFSREGKWRSKTNDDWVRYFRALVFTWSLEWGGRSHSAPTSKPNKKKPQCSYH